MSEFGIALFDLDDTLVDHSFAVEKSLAAVAGYSSALSDLEPAELRKNWRSSFWKYWQAVVSGEISLEQSRIERFRELIALLGGDPGVAENIAGEYSRMYLRNIRLIEGVAGLLETIRSRGIEIGVVTNTTSEMVREKFSRTDLHLFVRISVSAEEIGRMKPDPEIFNVALERTGFSPKEAVFTGDSITSDVRGARGVGMGTVWFNRFMREWTETEFTVPVLESYNPADHAYSILKGALNVH